LFSIAFNIRPFLSQGKPGTFKGIVLCESEMCDLALVTVDNDAFWDDLPIVEFADEVPNLGDAVLAAGYPLGNKSVTVTRGIVSTIYLKDLSLLGLNPRLMCIQIDAAINPGNSGKILSHNHLYSVSLLIRESLAVM
jgi:S1-C subfamily serine protease